MKNILVMMGVRNPKIIIKIDKMEVGDLVKIKPTTDIEDRANRICFVESLLGSRHAYGHQQEQVSLYAIDGEYIGDWFEDEFEELGKKITEKELEELIEKNKDKDGLVADFTKVLEVIQND